MVLSLYAIVFLIKSLYTYKVFITFAYQFIVLIFNIKYRSIDIVKNLFIMFLGALFVFYGNNDMKYNIAIPHISSGLTY